METRFKDPESKNRLKTLKGEAQKQIERNKVILKDLIQKYHQHYEGHSFSAPAAITETRTQDPLWRGEKWTISI